LRRAARYLNLNLDNKAGGMEPPQILSQIIGAPQSQVLGDGFGPLQHLII